MAEFSDLDALLSEGFQAGEEEDDEQFQIFLDELLVNSDPDEGAVCDVSSPPKEAPSSPEVDQARELRLLRNRISASQSRQRKKTYVKELEAKCRMLEMRCSQLEQSVSFVNTQNFALKGEVARLKQNNCVAEPAVPVMDSLQLEFLLRSITSPFSLPLLFLTQLWTTLLLLTRLGDLPLQQLHQPREPREVDDDQAFKSFSVLACIHTCRTNIIISSTSSSLWWPP